MFRVDSTRDLLDTAKKLGMPSTGEPMDANGSTYDPTERLIDIRGQIEHPMPGLLGWDAPTCLNAIARGVTVAEWALRQAVDNADGRGLGYFIEQIREHIPDEVLLPASP